MSDTAVRSATLLGPHGELVFTNRELGQDSRFWLTGLDGWFGGVGVYGEQTQRTLGHGLFPRVGVRSGRVLTLHGTLIFPDDPTRLIADRFLSGLLWDGEFGTLTVQTGELSLSCAVRLDGEIKHSYRGLRALDVQIPLSAPDPFLYAPVRVSQIFPAGAGQGLVYPLFNKVPAGIPVGSSAAPAPFTKTTFENNQAVTTNAGATGSVFSVNVTPGKTYAISTAAFADVSGSGHAIRFNSYGTTPSVKYIDLGDGGITVPPTPTKDTPKRATYTYKAQPGDTSISLTVFANHANYTVKNAQQTFAFKVTESDGTVLDWGKGAPLSAALGNEGNADAHPIITVRGDFPAGFALTWNGRSITYPSTVTTSTPVEVDSKTGSVLVGGVDQTYKLTSRDWFTVPSGSSFQPRITALAPSNGWADVSLSSTYI